MLEAFEARPDERFYSLDIDDFTIYVQKIIAGGWEWSIHFSSLESPMLRGSRFDNPGIAAADAVRSLNLWLTSTARTVRETVPEVFFEPSLEERYAALFNRNEALESPVRALIEYRKNNTLSFQLEKADTFINRMRAILGSVNGNA